MFCGAVLVGAVAGDPGDLVLEEMAARQREQEQAPAAATVLSLGGAPRISTFFLMMLTNDVGSARGSTVLRELLLERAHELLLARDAVVVVVGVAVADKGERIRAAQELVPGWMLMFE